MIISNSSKESNIALKLASYSLAGITLDENPYSDDELKAVYKYAAKSKLAAISFAPIEGVLDEDKLFDEESFYYEWKKLFLNAYRRSQLFDKETKAIANAFDKNGIWYMPLKGSVIKKFYPNPDAREMNDVDILIDDTKRDEIKDVMNNLGFKVHIPDYVKDPDVEKGEITKGENADEYFKEPFFHYELHKYLIEESYNPKMAKYYQSVQDMLIKDSDNECGYHFKDEDFYIYLFAHAHKHFQRNGIGPRFLMDVYVYLNSHKDMDFIYIEETCDKFGMKDFESDVRTIALETFDLESEIKEEELSDSQRKLYDSVIGAGVFGNLETRWKNEAYEMETKNEGSLTKKEYIKKRMFPDEQWYRIYHPFVARHRILKGPFTVYRLVVLAFRGRNRIKREIDYFDED